VARNSAIRAAYAQVLADYEPWHPLHPGEPKDLSRDQRAANLDRFLADRLGRIADLRRRFPDLDGPAAQLLDPALPVEPAIAEIEQWWLPRVTAVDLLPPIHIPALPLRLIGFGKSAFAHGPVARLAKDQDWHLRDDPAIARLNGFFRDLAALLGEAAVIRHPDFIWAVNEERRDRQMKHWGRVVIFRPATGERPALAIDLVEYVRFSYESAIQQQWSGRDWPPRPVSFYDGAHAGWFAGWSVANVVNRRMD